VEVHKRILSGSEYSKQTDGAATEKARRRANAMSVLVLGTDNRGAGAERRCLVGSVAVRLVGLLRYAGVDVANKRRRPETIVLKPCPHGSAPFRPIPFRPIPFRPNLFRPIPSSNPNP